MSITTPTQLTYMHNAQQKYMTEHTFTVTILVNQVIRKYNHLVSNLILPLLYKILGVRLKIKPRDMANLMALHFHV